MFLKRIKPKEGKKRTYWALVKFIRTARGPRHEVVSYLGELQGRREERVGQPCAHRQQTPDSQHAAL